MSVLVTGGAGFIGHHLVQRLTRDYSDPIIVLDNLRRPTVAGNGAGRREVLIRQQDIRDRAALAAAMHGCEIVFHLAAQSNVMGAVRDIEYSFSTNVQGTFNVLHAAREAGVKRVVFTSSREVYGDCETMPVPETAPMQPRNAYGASKACGEMYCRIFRESGLDVVVLRMSNAYGPGDSGRVIPLFIENAFLDRPLVLYGGTQIMDFVWVETVVDVLMQAAFGEYVPEPMNVGSGKGVRITDLADRIIQMTASRSTVLIEGPRQAEVSYFIADTTRAQERFNLLLPEDPLFGLQRVINSARPVYDGAAHL
jgi:UDP-glucose 4-epimerase